MLYALSVSFVMQLAAMLLSPKALPEQLRQTSPLLPKAGTQYSDGTDSCCKRRVMNSCTSTTQFQTDFQCQESCIKAYLQIRKMNRKITQLLLCQNSTELYIYPQGPTIHIQIQTQTHRNKAILIQREFLEEHCLSFIDYLERQTKWPIYPGKHQTLFHNCM